MQWRAAGACFGTPAPAPSILLRAGRSALARLFEPVAACAAMRTRGQSTSAHAAAEAQDAAPANYLKGAGGRRERSGPAAAAAAPASSSDAPAKRGKRSVAASTSAAPEDALESPTRTYTPKKSPPKKALEAKVALSTAVREKAAGIMRKLDELYPEPPIPLVHGDGFQLLCAVVLSAQTTDKKVNEVTPALFAEGPTPEAMAALPQERIEGLIRQIGLAPQKSKALRGLSAMLVEEFGGRVPRTYEELERLPGVGHKTASVVMAQVHGEPAFPVDTHIHRLAARWGLSDGSKVEQTEADLKAVFPREAWNRLHLQFIYFGREHCPAQRHEPAACPICSWAAGKGKGKSKKGARAAEESEGEGSS